MDSPVLWLGLVLCAALAASALAPFAPRLRIPALAAALVLAPVLVGADNWGSEKLAGLRDRPALVGVVLVLAAVGLVALALLVRRRPGLLAPALIAALPFRVPVDLGGGSANLLVPLYALIAAGVLAALLDRGGRPGGEQVAGADAGGSASAGSGDGLTGTRLPRWFGTALGAYLLLYALAAGYADDISAAVEQVAFFAVPFAALFVLLTRAAPSAQLLRTIVVVLVVEGALFALVAAGQYATGELFWNDKVIAGNEAHSYFRVNSLFYDPNILGRYLAVSMIALAGVVAFGRRRTEVLWTSAAFVVAAATLVATVSQTSTIALLAGIVILAAARWGLLTGLAAGLATVALVATSVALGGGGGIQSESSGRSGLIEGGLEIAADHLLIGAGSGSFATEFGERFGNEEGFSLESHTEPVTVAAEQGAVGVVAYAALLALTVGGLLVASGLRMRGRARAPAVAVLLAIYGAMIVHSLGYAAFLSDPITWVTLALAGIAPAQPSASGGRAREGSPA